MSRRSLVEPDSSSAEPFRALRLSIETKRSMRETTGLVFTSPRRLDGRSTIAANYAVVTALIQRPVLLIDADMRNPSLHEMFDRPRAPGLVEVLRDGLDPGEVAHTFPTLGGLYVLTSGSQAPSPGDVAASDAMAELLHRAIRRVRGGRARLAGGTERGRCLRSRVASGDGRGDGRQSRDEAASRHERPAQARPDRRQCARPRREPRRHSVGGFRLVGLVRAHGRRPLAIGLVAALAPVNVGIGALLTTARTEGTTLALLPLLLLALAVLIASDRAVLRLRCDRTVLAPTPSVRRAAPAPTPFELYLSDVLVALAVGSWVGARLIDRQTADLSALRTRVLGWPLALFGVLLFIAVLRGHALYGTSLVSVPMRFFLYAGIAFALTDLQPRTAYRWLVIVFYGGTIWQVIVGLHDVATGTAATGAVLRRAGASASLPEARRCSWRERSCSRSSISSSIDVRAGPRFTSSWPDSRASR